MVFFTNLVLDECLHTVSDKFHAQSEMQAARRVAITSWTTNWMHNSMEQKCYTIIGHMKLYAVVCTLWLLKENMDFLWWLVQLKKLLNISKLQTINNIYVKINAIFFIAFSWCMLIFSCSLTVFCDILLLSFCPIYLTLAATSSQSHYT